MKRNLFLMICIMMMPAALSAREMRVAVMDFHADGVSKPVARRISELVRSDMINSGKFVVIERAQMNQILKEQGLQQTGCTDTTCAVQAGKLLSARKILIGTVMQLAGKMIITGRIVDVEKGIGRFSAREVAADEEDLLSAVSRFTGKLIKRIETRNGIDGKQGGKDFLNKWHLVAMSSLSYDATFQGLGFSLNFGLETRRFYHGLYFTYVPEQDSFKDPTDSSPQVEVLGGGYSFLYRLWSVNDMFTASVGVLGGYFRLKNWDGDGGIYEKRRSYFGPMLRIEAGEGRYHFFFEFLPLLGDARTLSSSSSFGLGSITLNAGLKIRFYSF